METANTWRSMRSGLLLVIGVAIVLCVGCHGSPTSSSPITSAPNNQPTYAWAPCVVVQSPAGPPFSVQMQAAQKLQHAGKMSWIRLNVHLDGSGLEYFLEARRLGLKIFSIIHMSDLEAVGWETAFEQLHTIYPSDIWQVANEISNPDPNVNPVTITPDYYMSKFKNLYGYVKTNHPEAVLTNAPPYGSGSTGPPELEQFFKLGLLDLDVIVAINLYSNHALSGFSTVIDQYADRLAGKRIWVTETGSSNPDNHISWVQEFYPRIVNTVHPEMICWYVMWGGDAPQGDNGFGLLDQVQTGVGLERSLFKALTEGP